MNRTICSNGNGVIPISARIPRVERGRTGDINSGPKWRMPRSSASSRTTPYRDLPTDGLDIGDRAGEATLTAATDMVARRVEDAERPFLLATRTVERVAIEAGACCSVSASPEVIARYRRRWRRSAGDIRALRRTGQAIKARADETFRPRSFRTQP